jgi:hypothetical protein
VGLCAATVVHSKLGNHDCNCGEKQTVQVTASGQAAANAAVLTWADIGSTADWTGGATTPPAPSVPDCAGYHPKQADLVRVGSAAADYTHTATGILISSEVAVLQSHEMVRLDMRRTALSPQLVPCLREVTPAGLDDHLRLVSLKRVSFPHVGTYTAAWRLVTEDRPTGVHMLTDQIVIARGRTEIVLTVGSKLAAARVIKPVEVKLARTLARRIRA